MGGDSYIQKEDSNLGYINYLSNTKDTEENKINWKLVKKKKFYYS